MREIRFRAWDKDTETMLSPWQTRRFMLVHTWGQEHWKFMQYTGLKDKNGKEIYEGDIADIRYYGGGHTKDMFTPCICKYGSIVAHDPYGTDCYQGFYFEQVGGPNNVFPFSGNNQDLVEVIGNIYESPELLR